MKNETLLTAEEAAARLNRTAQTLAGWRTHGLGPTSRRMGARVYYSAADVDAWRATQTREKSFPPRKFKADIEF